jgi:hypothetical protein
MSKDPKAIKKKVVTNRPSPSTPTRRSNIKAQPAFPLLFNKQNYLYIGIGFGLVVLGLLLMLGGSMKDPNVWDESVIYSARRTVLAPIVILAGLAVEIYAIFKR